MRPRRVFRSVPVTPIVDWRAQVDARPLGQRDAHVGEYRDQLEHLVHLSPRSWSAGDEALWDCAPAGYTREAYARAQ